jgi:hypothetical protein
MVIVMSCVYDTCCVDVRLVLYAQCCDLCMCLAARDDIMLCHDRLTVV